MLGEQERGSVSPQSRRVKTFGVGLQHAQPENK